VARQLFERGLHELGPVERGALLDGPARLAAPALGIDLNGARPAEGDAAFAVMHGLYWLAANIASTGPLLIAVDVAHWADVQQVFALAVRRAR